MIDLGIMAEGPITFFGHILVAEKITRIFPDQGILRESIIRKRESSVDIEGQIRSYKRIIL